MVPIQLVVSGATQLEMEMRNLLYDYNQTSYLIIVNSQYPVDANARFLLVALYSKRRG